MKNVFKLLVATLLPILAIAQDDISQSNGVIGSRRYLGAQTTNGQSIAPILGMDSSDNTVLNCLSGKECQVTIAKTPVGKFSSTGLTFPSASQQVRNSVFPAVITPMTNLTPVAGAALSARVSLMATASPTLAYVVLPAATSNPNAAFGVYNKGASPLLMLLNGGVAATDAINASAAATPYSCATTKFCDCRVIGTGTYLCVSL